MITTLADFAGNHRTVTAAESMLKENRVPQTLVIEGPAGSGRKTLARLLTAGLLCNRSVTPCGVCDNCRLVQKNAHADVAFVAPLDGKAAISVDQIRQVRADAFVLPGQGSRKVFVVTGSMNDAAQNAFLKILEEPPAGVYFMLLCGHRSELIDTVLSRSVVLSLGAVLYEEALPLLIQNGWVDSPNTRIAFGGAGGLIGGLLTQSEQDGRLAGMVAGCSQAVANGLRADFLRAVAPAIEDRTLYPHILTGLYTLVRDALACQTGRSADRNAELLARRLTKEKLLALSKIISAEQSKLQYNPNGGLFFTALCAAIFPRR